jgi:hypothetical protein
MLARWSKAVAAWSQGKGARGVKGEAVARVRKGVPIRVKP